RGGGGHAPRLRASTRDRHEREILTMATTREWLRFITAAAASIVKDLNIYGPIGPSWVDDDAIAASAFIAELAPVPASTKTPRVHVNSVGGDPFTPATIVGALRAQRVELGRTVEVRGVGGLRRDRGH